MIAFLNPRVLLAVLLIAIGAAGAGYWKGHHDADQSAQIETLKADKADLERDVAAMTAARNEAIRQASAARDIAVKAAKREQAAQAAAEDRQGILDDYVRALAEARSADHCALSDDDVRRLRGIAEGAGRGSAPAPGPAGAAGNVRPAGPAAGAPRRAVREGVRRKGDRRRAHSE